MKVYGKKQIVMEKDEVDEIKKFDDPGLVLIGFKPMERLKLHHHLRPALFIYPEEEQITGKYSVVFPSPIVQSVTYVPLRTLTLLAQTPIQLMGFQNHSVHIKTEPGQWL